MAYLAALPISGPAIRIIIFNLILLVSCGYALRKGGPPEWIGAAIFIVAALLTALLVSPMALRFHRVEHGLLAVDVAVLAGFFILSLISERYWPLWMTSLQIIEVGTHLTRLIAPHLIPRAYSEAVTFWGYPMLILLGIATWRHQNRLKTSGADKSWKR